MRSLHVIQAIALNTFRETVRDRVLYAILIFAVLATLAGLVFGALSVQQESRVLEDLGLATISLFGGVIAVFIGTTLVFKEIDRRTIFLIVTKPINRWEFVTGKFLGVALCCLITNFAMGVFFWLLICFQTHQFVEKLIPIASALSLVYVELLLVIALGTFFSTFCTPLMGLLFTLGFWIVGHMSFSFQMMKRLAIENGNIAVAYLSDFLRSVMPDLALLTILRGEYLDGNFGSFANGQFGTIATTTNIIVYVIAYVVVLVCLSTMIASRREFN